MLPVLTSRVGSGRNPLGCRVLLGQGTAPSLQPPGGRARRGAAGDPASLWHPQECDNLWWDAFTTEFFEDDAMLTITFCLEDGPKRYSE